MLGIFSALGSFLGGPITAITGQVAGYFTSAKTVEGTEFAAMNAADQAQVIAYLQAQTALNAAKVTNNAHGAAYFMVWLFGLPAAAHWASVYLVNSWPFYHWHLVIPAVPPGYADAEFRIALSFFILAPALPVLNGLASRLRG